MDYFYFVVLDAAFLEVVFDVIYYFGDDFVGVAGVGAYAGYTDGGALPVFVVGYFGGGDVELVDGTGEDGFYVLALVFERVVLREVEDYAGGADYHLGRELGIG